MLDRCTDFDWWRAIVTSFFPRSIWIAGMSDDKNKLVTMTMTREEMIGDTWRLVGEVVEVPLITARRWVDAGYATHGGAIGDSKPGPPSHELGDFPSAALFAAAGFTTLEKVKALIAEKGDTWPKSVKSMTKPLAAKVSEFLEAQAKQSEQTATDTPPVGK